MKSIAAAGNTVVPGILALEALGFTLTVGPAFIEAKRGEERYVGEDPIAVLGLVKLVEVRGWDWMASDADIEVISARHRFL